MGSTLSHSHASWTDPICSAPTPELAATTQRARPYNIGEDIGVEPRCPIRRSNTARREQVWGRPKLAGPSTPETNRRGCTILGYRIQITPSHGLGVRLRHRYWISTPPSAKKPPLAGRARTIKTTARHQFTRGSQPAQFRQSRAMMMPKDQRIVEHRPRHIACQSQVPDWPRFRTNSIQP